VKPRLRNGSFEARDPEGFRRAERAGGLYSLRGGLIAAQVRRGAVNEYGSAPVDVVAVAADARAPGRVHLEATQSVL